MPPEKRSFFELSLLANHFPVLHGMRVLAILSVIQIHLSFELGWRGLMPIEGAVYNVSKHIWVGMDLFFFLSGFLIGTILLKAPEEGRGKSILRFYARRSFRIIPLYYVVLTLIAYITPFDAIKVAQLPREYLYLTNYSDMGHVMMFWAWSLCVEEHFYLAVPILMALLALVTTHKTKLRLLIALWLLGPAVRLFVIWKYKVSGDGDYFVHVYIPTHTRFDILIAGVLFAYLLHTEWDRLRAFMARPNVRIASVTLSFALFGMMLTMTLAHAPVIIGIFLNGTISGLAYMNLVLYLITSDGPVARFLSAPVFLRLATLGYGVYLVHFPILLGVGLASHVIFNGMGLGMALSFMGATMMTFLVSVMFAYGFHLIIEKPALALRDRFAPAEPRQKTITPA